MSTKPDGGAAFPRSALSVDVRGMSLRDWFAAQVLSASFANGNVPDPDPAKYSSFEEWAEETASICYTVADAMIAAREE